MYTIYFILAYFAFAPHGTMSICSIMS